MVKKKILAIDDSIIALKQLQNIMEKKFELIKEFNLGGCGYWQIMRWWRANWRLLYKNFYVRK